eukprot:g9213.t1
MSGLRVCTLGSLPQEKRVFSPNRSWPTQPTHRKLAASPEFYDLQRSGLPYWRADFQYTTTFQEETWYCASAAGPSGGGFSPEFCPEARDEKMVGIWQG